jgi:hypothetical protein
MRSLRHLLAALTLATLWLPARAQQPQRRDQVGIEPPTLRLLTQKSVQEELKMTPEQIQKLSLAFKKMRKLRDDADDQDKKLDFPDLIKINDALVKEILSADQGKRLKQISLQIGGARVFSKPALAKELKITEEQAKKLKTIQEESLAKVKKLFEEGESRQAVQKKVAEVNQEAMKKAHEVLTAEQRARWQEMIGAPFTGVLALGAPAK